MSQNIKCLDLKAEETLLNVLGKRKDAERAHMLYRLMLVTGLRIGEALRLNAGDATQAKVEVRVKGWTRDGEKLERSKIVYFPKALQERLAHFLRFKRRAGSARARRREILKNGSMKPALKAISRRTRLGTPPRRTCCAGPATPNLFSATWATRTWRRRSGFTWTSSPRTSSAPPSC